jgi:hypothetical protein
MWEGWKAGFLAFQTFHILSIPWPALACVFKERSYRNPVLGKRLRSGATVRLNNGFRVIRFVVKR